MYRSGTLFENGLRTKEPSSPYLCLSCCISKNKQYFQNKLLVSVWTCFRGCLLCFQRGTREIIRFTGGVLAKDSNIYLLGKYLIAGKLNRPTSSFLFLLLSIGLYNSFSSYTFFFLLSLRSSLLFSKRKKRSLCDTCQVKFDI